MAESVSGNSSNLIKLENILDWPKFFAEQEQKGVPYWDEVLELLDNETLTKLYEYFDQNYELMGVCAALIRKIAEKRNFIIY